MFHVEQYEGISYDFPVSLHLTFSHQEDCRMKFAEINLLAIALSGVASIIIGGLWYGPLFGKAWMNIVTKINKNLKKKQKGVARSLGISVLGAMALAVVLNLILVMANAKTLFQGIHVGFFVWLGIAVVLRLNGVLFEKRPFKLFMINASFDLILILAISSIIVLL